jgi:hypothetical protein
MGRGRLKRPVVDNAAGERRVLPVDVKSPAQGSRGFVDAASWKQHNRCGIVHGCGKMPVFGQQDPILFDATRDDCTVRRPAGDNDSVVTGRAQPSAEAVQHFVTQKPRHLSNLSPHAAGSISPRCSLRIGADLRIGSIIGAQAATLPSSPILMFQKESALALWYRARTADSRIGTRKIMIVALARKLIIALWRFVTTGELGPACREPRPRHRRHARDTSARRRCAPPSRPNASDRSAGGDAGAAIARLRDRTSATSAAVSWEMSSPRSASSFSTSR